MAPRIPPLPPASWPEAMGEALAALRPPTARHPMPPRDPDRPKGLNALGTFAHHPDLTRAFNSFNGHILFGTTLTPRERELLVLRVAARRNCEYEWVQHVVLGADAGLTADEIEAVADTPDSPNWTPHERALLTAVDELLDDALVSDETWRVLGEGLEVEQLMDLVFTVGCYDLVAMAFRSFGLELDADLLARKRPSP